MQTCLATRPFAQADAKAVSGLLDQLGYPVESESQVLARYADLAGDDKQAVLVAECAGKVVGLIHMARVYLLASDGYVEVHALVVDEAARGMGVGARLLDAAEVWTQRFGNLRVRLGSGVHRLEAHRFYEHLGYTKRPGFTFEKRLTAAAI
ncbi:GNAT family N-acetyltransferase [Chitinimonas sp. BJYL2]|uniref:GNAT family N-acetyltransferase n=1 Tax=Chitinimonas sp. BJYL2 TaxID=2976696 RepID=UPI0022B30D4F|nr:GNAT family N-acetyltransferase [Chitinimonas sp. BJYL2]